MSADIGGQSDFASLNRWGKEFLEASKAHDHTRRRRLDLGVRRRLAVPLAIALALPTGAAIAAATNLSGEPTETVTPVLQVHDDGGPPFELPTAGDVVGYVDLGTGQPILCPDGKALKLSVSSNADLIRGPSCANGSVPETYVRQERAWREWLNTGAPDLAANGPNFQVILEQGTDRGSASHESSTTPPLSATG